MPWTAAEIEQLRVDLQALGLAGTARSLRRPPEEVKAQAELNGYPIASAAHVLAERGTSGVPDASRPRRGRACTWSAAEDARIIEGFPTLGASGLVGDPIFNARTEKAITVRAGRLGVYDADSSELQRAPRSRWTQKEDDILMSLDSEEEEELEDLLHLLPGRSLAAIRMRYSLLKDRLVNPPVLQREVLPWSYKDDERLAWLYGSMPPRKVAERLGRTYAAVTNRASALGLTKAYNSWSPEDDAELRARFSTMPMEAIGRLLGFSPLSCRMRAAQLGMSAEDAFIATPS